MSQENKQDKFSPALTIAQIYYYDNSKKTMKKKRLISAAQGRTEQ